MEIKAEITVTLTVGKREIVLTDAEAKQLRDELNRKFPEEQPLWYYRGKPWEGPLITYSTRCSFPECVSWYGTYPVTPGVATAGPHGCATAGADLSGMSVR